MENYEWGTIEGRYKAARQCMRLEAEKKVEEAEKLREKLREAMIVYEDPEYIIMKDENDKPLYLHINSNFIIECDGWRKFRKNFADKACCHAMNGYLWVKGNIPIKGEEWLVKKNLPHWFAFEDNKSEVWFIQI